MDRFLKLTIRMRELRNYELRHIGNMDETPVWLEMPGKYTLDFVGADDVTVKSMGQEKKRYTVKLAGLADGTKLPPMVLLPGVRPPPKADIPAGRYLFNF